MPVRQGAIGVFLPEKPISQANFFVQTSRQGVANRLYCASYTKGSNLWPVWWWQIRSFG